MESIDLDDEINLEIYKDTKTRKYINFFNSKTSNINEMEDK